jgi:hypothetical protein
MIAYLRNVQTGEIREVEQDSDEMRELQEEVYDHGDGRAYPRWEQTGDHAVRRIDEGNVHVDPDLGYEDKVLANPAVSGEGLQADPHPERSLTQAEVEAGIESHEEKLRNLGHHVPGDDAEKIERGLSRVGREGGQSSRARSSSSETKADLLQRAEEQGVEADDSMTKAQIREALGEEG